MKKIEDNEQNINLSNEKIEEELLELIDNNDHEKKAEKEVSSGKMIFDIIIITILSLIIITNIVVFLWKLFN